MSYRIDDAKAGIWHASALSTYLGCGMQYQYSYVEGHWTPATSRMVTGTIIHRGIEHILTARMADGLVSEDDVAMCVSAAVMEELGRDVKWTDEESADLAAARERIARRALDGIGAFRSKMANLVPAAVEQDFRIECTKWGFGLAGRIDCIATDSTVWDWKTSEKSGNQKDADRSTQLTIYGLAMRATSGAFPVGFGIGKIVVTPSGRPHMDVYPTTREDVDYVACIRRIRQATRAVRAGVFLPCAQDEWRCSEDWCGHWDRCPYGRRGRSR
jgi:hypothetical protein